MSKWLPLIVGMLSAFAAGVFAISILLRYLRTHSLTVFVVYRFVAGRPGPRVPRDPVTVPWR